MSKVGKKCVGQKDQKINRKKKRKVRIRRHWRKMRKIDDEEENMKEEEEKCHIQFHEVVRFQCNL